MADDRTRVGNAVIVVVGGRSNGVPLSTALRITAETFAEARRGGEVRSEVVRRLRQRFDDEHVRPLAECEGVAYWRHGVRGRTDREALDW